MDLIFCGRLRKAFARKSYEIDADGVIEVVCELVFLVKRVRNSVLMASGTEYRMSMQDFPTPEFPMMRSLKR